VSLSSIYIELHRAAARTGIDRAIDLKGGARLAVRVQAGIVTLTISRKAKKLGTTEIDTFKRDCGVPASAIRFPLDTQGTKEHDGATWFYVAYRWAEGVDQ
jgi:hypothetical protein